MEDIKKPKLGVKRMPNCLKRFFDKLSASKSPIKYWRKKGAIIGENCSINVSCSFGSEPYLVRIGNHVRVNPGVVFITHDGGVWVFREDEPNIDIFKPIVIGNNVHIGTNAVIMPGVSIGDNCIIGCCAVVTHNIPSNSVAVGVPARVIETIDIYKKKHLNDFEFIKNLESKSKKDYLTKKYMTNIDSSK